MAVREEHLFVQGVGKLEQAQITVSVLDGLGNPLDETASGYAQSSNNLRVTLQTRPGGGEMLSGLRRLVGADRGVDMETVRDGQSVEVRTTAGEAVVTLRSGSLPGVVALKSELLDTDGTTVLATAISALIVISSGPPHSMVLTHAFNDSLVNMSIFGLSGTYCQTGSVLVTDRYGNAVPNGTPISLGLVDTIIHEGYGEIMKDSSDLTLVSSEDGFQPSFDTATAMVGGVPRQIQAGDRILIPTEASPADRSRFVKTTGSATQLDADLAYLRAVDDSERKDIHYLVGASLRGGAIHGYSDVSVDAGCDPVNLTTGITTTAGGIAPVRVTYPANKETILTGCFENVMEDERHANPRSAQVLAIASTNDGLTTTINHGGFCFHAAAPSKLTAVPDVLSYSTSLTITLEDAGGVRLPFIPVTCTSVISTTSSGFTSVDLTPKIGSITDENGQAFFHVEVSGGESGIVSDYADIVCLAMDARLTVNVRVP